MANSPISRWDVRVVFATTLAVRAYIPRWTSLDFSDQLSDVGSGKITLDHNDTFVEQFDLQYGDGVLFDGTHAIQILRDGVLAYTFLIEDVDVQRVGYSQETVIAGRGIAGQLDWAIILPENYSASMNQVSLETAGQQLLARELVGYEFLVRVATTTNLSATHSTGTDGTGMLIANASGEFPTLDGTDDIVVTDTILIKNQTNTAHNGVYSVDDVGSVSTPWVLTRISDLNFYEDRYCYVGARVFVSEGTSNGEKAFQIASCPTSTATEPGKGTTALTFTAATIVYTAVSGFYILFTEASTGNELSMLRGASWGTVRSGYGRGGIGNAISWALSLESTLNAAKGLTDSKGSTPKDGGSITLDFGRSLLETIQTVCEQTECHWHVSPSGVVSIARKPSNLYTVPFGTDRTSGSSAVMLPLPLANSSQTKTSARDLRSTVFGSNSYLIDYSTDNDITATHGRREGFYTSSGNDSEAVSNISSAGLKKAAGLTFGVEIDFVETLGRQAFINFAVGDKILIEYKIGSYESRIVNGISVSIDSSMQTNVQLTLEAVVPDSLVKLQNQSIYGTSQGSRLKAYLNSGNQRVAAASVRTTPISTVEGMSNRVEVSWNISGSANASGYEATVYRTDSLNRATAISRTSTNATVTTPDAHGIQVGDLVTVSIVNPAYSTFSATNAVVTAVNTASLTGQTFTYVNSGANVSGSLTDASTVDGGIKVSSWARVNNAVTLTTARNHGLLVGERIIVAATTNTTVDAFKVVITAVPSTTTLKYSNPGPDASGSPTAATVKKIVEFHSTQASAYQTSATVEGLSTSGRPYLTQIISLNSSGEQCESTVPVSFFSSENAMEVVGGAIKSPNYIAGSAGWFIGSSGMAEFSNVTVRGAVTAATIDIGSGNTSFHVDTSGNIWSGNTSIGSAPFRVSNLGALTATSGNIGGWTIDSNSLFSGTKTASGSYTPTTGQMTIGSDGHISANKFRINSDGSLFATGADIGGAVTATTLSASSSGRIGPFDFTGSGMNSIGYNPQNYMQIADYGDIYVYSAPVVGNGAHGGMTHTTGIVGEYIVIGRTDLNNGVAPVTTNRYMVLGDNAAFAGHMGIEITENNTSRFRVYEDGNVTAAGFIAAGATGYTDAGSVSASGWFRSKGETGWYSQDYGGGIYMNDANTVKVYNDKNFLTGGTIWGGGLVTGDAVLTGDLTVKYGGVDGGIVIRPWTASGTLLSIATAGMTGGEYMMLSNGTSTYISSGAGGGTYLRGPINDSNHEVVCTDTFVGLTGTVKLQSVPASTPYGYYLLRDIFTGEFIHNSSNRDLKENIVPLSGALDTINKLSPSSFNWKIPPGAAEDEYRVLVTQTYKSMGFILEDVLDVSPELVTWRVSEEDWSVYAGYWKTDDFIALAIQGIKDLHEKILFLEDEVKALKEP